MVSGLVNTLGRTCHEVSVARFDLPACDLENTPEQGRREI